MVEKKELIAEIEAIDVVSCTTSGGNSFYIGTDSYWIGGSDDGFMCDFIGNVEYFSAESCVNALFRYLDEINETIEDID